MNGIERIYEEAAYLAALMLYLIEFKHDHETDEEIANILKEKPYMFGIIISVMEVSK